MRQKVVLLGALVVVALIAISTALASNAPAISFTAPSPAEGATVGLGSSVQFTFSYNRTTKQTRSLNCALSGPNAYFVSAACPSSSVSFSSLAPGSYTFTVTLTLTDRGTASATRHFTVSTRTQAQLDCGSSGTCADLSLSYFPNNRALLISNAGPVAATVTVRVTCDLSGPGGYPFVNVPGWTSTNGPSDSTSFSTDFTSSDPVAVGSSQVVEVSANCAGHAEVYSSSRVDPDSTPNNGVATEDDYVAIG